MRKKIGRAELANGWNQVRQMWDQIGLSPSISRKNMNEDLGQGSEKWKLEALHEWNCSTSPLHESCWLCDEKAKPLSCISANIEILIRKLTASLPWNLTLLVTGLPQTSKLP